MLNFVATLLKFALPLLTVLAAVAAYAILDWPEPVVPWKRETKYLFIGDSHVQRAINDREEPEWLNVAERAEVLYFSRWKFEALAKAIDQQAPGTPPGLQRVYLGLNAHSFSGAMRQFIIGQYSRAVTTKYSPVLPKGERWRLLLGNLDASPTYLLSMLCYRWEDSSPFQSRPLSEAQAALWGGFRDPSVGPVADTTLLMQRIQDLYYCERKVCDFAPEAFEYVRIIQAQVEARGLQFVVLDLPVHPDYAAQIPEVYRSRFESFLREGGYRIERFENLEFTDVDFLPDGDHLSPSGAAKVTAELRRRLGPLN